MRRTCPVCTLREAGVVSDDCPVCNGHGVVELGDRALKFFTPGAVSTSVHLALEVQARILHDTTTRAQDPRPALNKTLAQLAKAGIIHPPKPPAPAKPGATGRHPGPPAEIVRRATGAAPTRGDELMIRAHPYVYQPGDRPGVRGTPLFSSNGHPSSLACVLDPVPFETTTQEQALARTKRMHDARVLAGASTTTPRRRK